MDKTITLTRVYNPLNRADQDTVTWQHQPGMTVADLLDATGAIISTRESVRYAVAVNGLPVPEEQRALTVLLPGQHVVCIPVLHGGFTDILRMVAIVALAIVAPYAGAALAGFMVGAGAAMGIGIGVTAFSVLATVGAAAFMIGGAALVNAVLSPAKPQLPALGNIDQSNSYAWNPANRQQQGVPIPMRYGTCKIAGDIIGTYRESNLDKQYVNVLISCGAGPFESLYDYKLNGQPLSNYTGVELYTRMGHLDQPVMPNFGDTVQEYSLSSLVASASAVTYTTIGNDFDAIEVEVGFPGGLYQINSSGSSVDYSVDLRIEISPHGLDTWQAITTQPGTVNASAGGYWSAGYWVQYSATDTAYYDVWEEYTTGGTDPTSHNDGEYYDVFRTWRWIGEPIYKVATTLDYVTITAAKTGALRYTYKTWGLSAGKYDVRVTKLTADKTSTIYGDDLYLQAVREIMQDDFTYPGTVLVGIRGLASETLSGSFSFECKTTGRLVRVYNGSSWSVAASNNPAWIVWDILTQPVFDNSLNVLEYAGRDPSTLDQARFYEWAQYCDDLVPDGAGGTEKRLTWDGPFDAAMTTWDAALQVARIGRATPYFRGQTITVAIDKPADPVALITVGNIGLDSFEETFLPMDNRAGSVDADFLNVDKDLERDKLTIINTSAPASWGAASLPLQGVIKPSAIWRHCQYYLATTQLLTRVVSGMMDVDAIAFTLGDVINVQHDVPEWGIGGRLVSATSSSVTLDQTVTLAADITYLIMVRLLDGTLAERTVTNSAGSYTVLNLSSSFTTTPEPFDLYAFGPSGLVVKPMRVTGIDPSGDLKRKITLVDYNESIYNTDLLQPVVPTTNYSSGGIDPVADLSLTERLVKRADGTIDDYLVISFTKPTSVEWAKAELWLYNRSTWTKVGESSTGDEQLFQAAELEQYTVRAVSVDNMGNRLADNKCPTASISTLGKTALPADVIALQAEITRGQMRIYWAANADVDIAGYELQIGTVWDDPANKVLVTGYAGTSYAWTPDRTGTISILAKSIDTSGNYSTTATRLDYTISGPGTVATLTQQVIDNIVELKWSAAAAGSFPIDYYEVWKGSTFATAELLGRKYSTFDLLQETVAGTYKYWIRAVDVAGLAGAETGVYAAVNQPPDYVLIDQQNLVFEECTLTNALIENNQIILPINTSISFEDHFINNPDTTLDPWSTPQDQIDDGYPLYGQPAPATASIERVIDYGAVIPSSKLTMSVTRTALAGNVTFTPEIFVGSGITSDNSSIKADSTAVTADADITWVSLGNMYEVAANNFRYVKYRLVATTTDGGMAAVQQISTKLDVKRRTLVVNTINVTDTTGDGTEVTFASLGIAPVDIVGIVAEAPYTGNTTNDPIKALVNFVDAPNPASFKVLCWNKSDVRVAASGVTATISYI